MNIYLVGFMGTGKTSVAKVTAKRLKMQFIEMDEIIEEKEGRRITEIFRDEGEDYFRKIEKDTLDELSKKNNLVISCGGGVVLDKDNVRKMKKSGIMICLWARPDIVYERIKGQSHRPLLNVENPKEKIKELLNYREPFYKKAAYHIDTSTLSIKNVADKVINIANAVRKNSYNS